SLALVSSSRVGRKPVDNSFDHLVGLSEKRRRDFEIQSLCCLLIYNELEFCWSLDGEVSWVFSAKHLVHVMRCASVLVHKFNAVGHNSTILREVTVGVQSNETMNRNERDDLGTMNDRKHIRHHDQAGVPRVRSSAIRACMSFSLRTGACTG